MNTLRISILLLFVCVAVACEARKQVENNALAAPPRMAMETDILTARPGYTGSLLGARVISSEPGPYGKIQVIEVEVPVDPDRVDSIEVVSPTGETIKQRRTAEVLRNYENDNVGITLFLSPEKNWRFRLKLIDNQENY